MEIDELDQGWFRCENCETGLMAYACLGKFWVGRSSRGAWRASWVVQATCNFLGTSGLERDAVRHDLLHFHRRLSSSPETATIVECLVSCNKTHLGSSGLIPVVFTSRKSPENNDLLPFCNVRWTFSNIWAHFYGDFGFHLQQNWFILVVCS